MTSHLRNDLYCVEWDVKLYYTIPYKDDVTCILLVTAILTFLVSDVPLVENNRLPMLAHLLGNHYLMI